MISSSTPFSYFVDFSFSAQEADSNASFILMGVDTTIIAPLLVETISEPSIY